MSLKVCNRCVMDNRSDNTIKFDDQGNCNYCNQALSRMNTTYFPNIEGKRKLDDLIEKLILNGKGKKYDCMMGLSGGLDSSYLAYVFSKYNLRILAITLDDGLNTVVADENIRKICDSCNIKLIVEKPDKEQYVDLIRAFILAGVPGIPIPQDNVLQATLYKYAKQYGIKFFLSGANFSLESILQRGNSHNAADKIHIKAIAKEFGTKGIDRLNLISITENYIFYKYFNRIKLIRPLDYMEYNKKRAIQELNDFCGFNYYGGKHYESIFTKFVQSYYLPKKFNIDKRTSHLSSLIITGQITRKDALLELEQPLYDEYEMNKDIDFLLTYLKFTREEFNKIMAAPPKMHRDYKVSILNNFADIARKYRRYLAD